MATKKHNTDYADGLTIISQLIPAIPRPLVNRQIGARIAHLRHAHKLTQQQLSDRLGQNWATRSYISNLECGRHECSLTLLKRIAKELKTTCAYLLGEDQEYFSLTQEEKRLITALRLLKAKGEFIY
ncbi:MAG: helix-turn-helix domain-containing protein [Candidatus Aquicultor sp.]